MSELAPEPFRLPDLSPVPSRRRFLPLAAGLLAVVAGVAVLAAGRGTRTVAGGGTGVVVIETNLAYQGAAAAGTGIVLASSGEILTNNHVVRGATTIRVVVPGTGRTYSTYTATVAGYDVSRDIAVLQAQNASGLKTASLADSSTLQLGDTVTAVGNAGGTGALTRATGAVTALDTSITANDDAGGSELLNGLIETSADVQPGDSGGPLLDASGRVVGVDTAAASAGGYQNISQTTAGYAVPIGTALEIAGQIESGDGSSTVHVGTTGFLGVSLQSDPYGGVSIADVVSGGAADDAGLAPGDVITAIDGRSVSAPADVSAALLGKHAGDTVAVSYVRDGTSETVTAGLESGPAQ